MSKKDKKNKIAKEQRYTDWLKMDSLNYLADQKGMAVMSFLQTPDGWKASYFKPTLRTEPKPEYCRDDLDYNLRLKEWIRDCTMESKYYPTFQAMILGEIEVFKNAI